MRVQKSEQHPTMFTGGFSGLPKINVYGPGSTSMAWHKSSLVPAGLQGRATALGRMKAQVSRAVKV